MIGLPPLIALRNDQEFNLQAGLRTYEWMPLASLFAPSRSDAVAVANI